MLSFCPARRLQTPSTPPAQDQFADPDKQDALLNTYANGFRNVWLTALPFVVVAAIGTLFLIDPTEEFNNHIDAPVEKDEDLYTN